MPTATRLTSEIPAPDVSSLTPAILIDEEEAKLQAITTNPNTAHEPNYEKQQRARAVSEEAIDSVLAPGAHRAGKRAETQERRTLGARCHDFAAWGLAKLQSRKAIAEPETSLLARAEKRNSWMRAAHRVGTITAVASTLTIAARTARAMAAARYGIDPGNSGANQAHTDTLIHLVSTAPQASSQNSAPQPVVDALNAAQRIDGSEPSHLRTAHCWEETGDCLWNWYKDDLRDEGKKAGLSPKQIEKLTCNDKLICYGVDAYIDDNPRLRNCPWLIDGETYSTDKAHHLAHDMVYDAIKQDDKPNSAPDPKSDYPHSPDSTTPPAATPKEAANPTPTLVASTTPIEAGPELGAEYQDNTARNVLYGLLGASGLLAAYVALGRWERRNFAEVKAAEQKNESQPAPSWNPTSIYREVIFGKREKKRNLPGL